MEAVHAGDASGRLFVLEQAGRIRVVEADGNVRATPFLDITPLVRSGGEQGLLGLAFHPRYVANGLFYVYYTAPPPEPARAGSTIVLARYSRSSADPNVANAASGQVILTIPHVEFPNHNGGKILFGPDAYLYIGVGDGGGGGDPFGAAQDLGDLRGKILRIDVDGASPYAVPPSNPFIGQPSARAEVYAYGLRNPWRFAFDRETDDAFIADVGQDEWEEVDHVPAGTLAGRNFGWSTFEGTHCFRVASGCSLPGATAPVIEYAHDAAGGASIIGGYRYRGRSMPQLLGRYVYGDFASGHVWAAAPGLRGIWSPRLVATVPGISSFGEDEAGELFVVDRGAGTLLRLAATRDLDATPEGSRIRRWLTLR